jgi:glycosyltransferase involved in cell wall biosynthesis
MGLDYYRPNVSGLTLYVENLAEGLAGRGHAVTVLTHRHEPSLPRRAEENGVRVVRAAVAARVGKALVSPAILAAAVAELSRADVLHLHAPLVNAVPFSALASTLRVPILVTFHCDLQPPPRLLPARRRGARPGVAELRARPRRTRSSPTPRTTPARRRRSPSASRRCAGSCRPSRSRLRRGARPPRSARGSASPESPCCCSSAASPRRRACPCCSTRSPRCARASRPRSWSWRARSRSPG